MIIEISQWASSLSSEAIISSSALFLTLITLYQTRRHNRLSVTPHLNTFLDNLPDGRINLSLINNRIGPAKIKDITVFIDGEQHSGNLQDIAFDQIQRSLPTGIKVIHAKHLDTHYAILNGERIILFSAQVLDESLTQNEITNYLKRIHFLIKYQSFYRRTFELDTRKTFWNNKEYKPKA